MPAQVTIRLRDIQDDVQKIAEAIASALQLESEIVDDELTIIAGTGPYRQRLGEKEEGGDPDAGYIYGRTLRSGQPLIAADAANDPAYDPAVLTGTVAELAEVCAPIMLRGRVIGAIGLIAFSEEQRVRLLAGTNEYLEFVDRMANLLASKAAENAVMQSLTVAFNQLRTIIEGIDQGVIAFNRDGIVQHSNSAAARLLHRTATEMENASVEAVMPGSPLREVLRTGKGYELREESYKIGAEKVYLHSTVRPIVVNHEIAGAVVTFRDSGTVRKLAYEIMSPQLRMGVESILGRSSQIREVRERVQQIAQTNATVLITGETGTGKGVVASAIHHASSRSQGPLIVVNCAAIPDELLESELFGYNEGAFSGARRGGKPGKFELANGGTILLDEIGEMPLRLQPKLLQVLQSRSVERVGGTSSISLDLRVVAATNQDLERMISEREFREDLYYRLNVIPVHLPPFRERKDDIPLLLDHFLAQSCAQNRKAISGFDPEVRQLLLSYDWPGNVRELENAVEYMVSFAEGERITLASVPPRIRSAVAAPAAAVTLPCAAGSLTDRLDACEKELLLQALAARGRTPARIETLAAELQVSRATLYRKLARHGLLNA